MRIEGRVALVTGGARRVGRALSLALARAGADVLVNYHRSERQAKEVVREIERLGRRAAAVHADLEGEDAPQRLVDATVEHLDRLDILVNSAASFRSAPLLEIDARAWDQVLALNLRAPFLLARAAAPLLREEGGVIVNIADLSAFQPWPSYAHHAVSKAGLVHLTRVLARGLAPEIRANAIAPGTVLPPEDSDDAEVERDRRGSVLGRIGDPADVARALLFLVESDFVTGEVVIVDGGRLLR